MLIVLYGTSSSGKTSLAQALQKGWPAPLLHIEADRFAPTVLPGRVADDDRDFRERYLLGIHHAIAAFGRSGIDTIADGSMPSEPDLRDRCLSILRDSAPTKLVAVRCSIEELRRRQTARAHPVPGWAEEQRRTIYGGLTFDCDIDTTSKPPVDCALDLLHQLYNE